MIRAIGSVIIETFHRWVRDRCHGLGAALAFYALLTVPSFVALTISCFNYFFGAEKVQKILVPYLQQRADPRFIELIRYLAFEFKELNWSALSSGLIGILALALGVGGFSIQLKESLETLRGKRTSNFGIKHFILERVWTVFLSSVFAVTAMLSISIRIFARTRIGESLKDLNPALIYTGDLLLTWLVIGGLSAILFTLFREIRIPWRDALRGGVITGFLFVIGREFCAGYLTREHAAGLTGIGGDIILFLLWSYFYSQVFFIGAELTHVLTDRRAG